MLSRFQPSCLLADRVIFLDDTLSLQTLLPRTHAPLIHASQQPLPSSIVLNQRPGHVVGPHVSPSVSVTIVPLNQSA